jgi:hypothetical protein
VLRIGRVTSDRQQNPIARRQPNLDLRVMRPMRSVQLDFTDRSSVFDLALYLGRWEAAHPDQENDL